MAQLSATLAVFALLFFLDQSYEVWAYAVVGAIVVLEIAEWAIAREALRRTPNFSPQALYASLPLDGRQRRRLMFTLVLSAILPALFLATGSFEHVALVAVLIVVAVAPGFLALYRVWRHNSWLAVSRIPAQPRRPKGTT